MQRWRVGDVVVTKLVELELAGKATWILPAATRENLLRDAWLQPHFVNERGDALMSVHAFVVESQGRRIVVDTCIGNDKRLPIPSWNQRQGPFLADLAAAGFPAESIDTVLCTHLHIDHIGWNTRLENGRWVPTFANARYLWSREEYEHWDASGDEANERVLSESVRPVFEAGLVDLVASDQAVTDEVRLEPTPGHTPGHVSVHIRSRGEEAVITGDLMHHPVQIAHPDWGSSADFDKAQAEATRQAFLARYAGRPVLVLGTHFAGPTGGRLLRDGDAYRLEV
jgi:glyoxylase-like metal-dependent hydrolase (beta-lactamase superfamily II)